MDESTADPARLEALPPKACRCRWADRRDHDRMTQIESADTDLIAELLEDATSWRHYGDDDREGRIGPYEYADFAAVHNWRDPVATFRLLRALNEVATMLTTT